MSANLASQLRDSAGLSPDFPLYFTRLITARTVGAYFDMYYGYHGMGVLRTKFLISPEYDAIDRKIEDMDSKSKLIYLLIEFSYSPQNPYHNILRIKIL